MKAHTWTGLAIVLSLLLSALPVAVAAPPAGMAPAAPRGGGESLSGSYVEFHYTGGFPPIACLTAESFTTDSEYVYTLWAKFPANWTVSDVYVLGTPSCAGGGTWGEFGWSFETWPNEVMISHPRYQSQSDDCVATYCFQVLPVGSKADTEVSWYWQGGGDGNTPHHPCSNDGYTPASMAAYPCDEAVLPPADILPWCCHPWWWPERLETSGCNGLPQAHELELHNDYWEPLTFDLSYSVVEGDGTLTGPVTVTAGAFEVVSVGVQLTPELCAVPGTRLIAQIDATALGITWTATIVKTILGTGGWASRPNSVPTWTGTGGVGDGCTAVNAEGQTVTYVIGGDETAQPGGLWAYNHNTNTWSQPNPGDSPAGRSEAEWAYDPGTNLCYLTGGRSGPSNTNSNEAYAYDPVSNVFSALPVFTTARHAHDSWLGTVDGAKMLCIGGGSAGGTVTSTQCYDVSTRAWAPENATLGAYPVYAEASADGTYHAAGGDQFWFVGGLQAYAVDDAAYYWDDADDTWHSAGHTGHGRAALEGDFIGDAFYQVGGWYSQPLPPSATVVKGEMVDGTWTWTQLPDMPHARQYNVAVQAGGRLWSIAGEGDITLDYVDYVVSCPSCETQGWLTGRVADAETGGEAAPCSDAEVGVEPGGIKVPVDPATGVYGPLQLDAGAYTVTVTAPGYLTDTAQVTIVDGVTTTHDAGLYRAAIEVSPPALSVAALPGVPVTLALTVANVGHLPLEYEISEIAAGRPPTAGRQTPAALGRDPLIAQHMALAPDGKAMVFVAFEDTADLSAPHALDDKAARVQVVRAALRRAADQAQAKVRAWLEQQGIEYRVFYVDNTLLIEADRATVEALAAFPEVSGLRGNHTYRLLPVDHTAPSAPGAILPWNLIKMNVSQAWEQGVTGEGAIVANVDTGVYYQHEALLANYVCDGGPHTDCWLDPTGGSTAPYDNLGHGTWTMSGSVAGNDPDFEYAVGAAPGAGWIACLGCPNGSCPDLSLNACADWLVMGTPYTPDVVTNAWGAVASTCDTWYLGKLQAYQAAGILPVFGAGGGGPGCNTDSSPANNPGTLAVGSSSSEDLQAPFSGTGPGSCAGKLQFPDVVAPGVNVCAATPDGGYTCNLSGTSFSAGFASGCAALVKSAAPWLSGDEIGAILRSTAYDRPNSDCGAPQPDPNYRYGDGRIDCLAAVEAARSLEIPWVWEAPASAIVPPQAGLPVSVTFQCTISDVGQILTGTLRIDHNDPCAAPVDVPVELRCTDEIAPDIELSLPSIEAALCTGAWAATTLGVCNTGTAPLDWTIDEVPPTAWLSESPISGTATPNTCQPVEVTFDATAMAPGEYPAALHVASNDPDQPDIDLPVTMIVPAPASGAAFEWSPPEPLVGETVLFSGTVAAGDPPFSFAWAFGDGAMAGGPTVTYAYASPGPYTVTLGVANACGQAGAAHTVRVVLPRRYVYLPIVCKGCATDGQGR